MLRYPFSRRKAKPAQASPLQESPDFEKLAQSLQPLLQAQIMASQLQARCAIRQGNLFVLIEHLLHVEPNSQETFTELEAIVRKNVAEQIQTPSLAGIRGKDNLPVRLFLRIAGHQQPYQFHTFSVSLTPVSQPEPIVKSVFEETGVLEETVSLRDGRDSLLIPVPIELPQVHTAEIQSSSSVGGFETERTVEAPIEPSEAAYAVTESASDPAVLDEEQIVPSASEPAVLERNLENDLETESSVRPSAEVEPDSVTPAIEVEPEAIEPVAAHRVNPEAEAIESEAIEPAEADLWSLPAAVEPDLVEATEAYFAKADFVEPDLVEPVLVEPDLANSAEVEPDFEASGAVAPIVPLVNQTENKPDLSESVAAVSLADEVQEEPQETAVAQEALEPVVAIDIQTDLEDESAEDELAEDEQFNAAIEQVDYFESPAAMTDAAVTDSERVSELGVDVSENMNELLAVEASAAAPVDELENPENWVQTKSSQPELEEVWEYDRSNLVEPESEPAAEPDAELSSELISKLSVESSAERLGDESVDEMTETELQELESLAASPGQSFLVLEPIEPVILQPAESALLERDFLETEISSNLPEPANPEQADAEPNEQATHEDEQHSDTVPELLIEPTAGLAIEEPIDELLDLSISEPNGESISDLIDEPNDIFIEPLTDQPTFRSADSFVETPERLTDSRITIPSEGVASPEAEATAAIEEKENVFRPIPQHEIDQEELPRTVADDGIENVIENDREYQNKTQPVSPASTPKVPASVNSADRSTASQTAANHAVAGQDPKAKEISFSEVLELEAWSDRQSFLRRMSLSAWIFAGTVGVFSVVAGVYTLTRPCVVGGCPPIEQAQQMSDRALNTIQTTESALAIVEAHNQLRDVNVMLSPIPFWSPHYESAQQIMRASEARASRVAQIVNALEKANQAAQKSQNPPHPLAQWREIQWLWRDAIAALQRIPPDSPVYDLAQRRLQEYESSLADINKRVSVEQNAQERVNAARRTAEVAEAQAGIAKSAQDWQQSYAAWQAAVRVLDDIPQGTMAYAEAVQLLALYKPRLQEAEQRQGQESIAENALRQANQFAEQARSLEQQNQWTNAKAAWQQAVSNLQLISQGTVYYTQAQSTLQSYSAALSQAEKNATRLVAMQAVQSDLDRTCAEGMIPLCSYSFTPQSIRVQITRSYDQATERIMTSNQRGSTQAIIATQVTNLLRSLAAISETAQVPIELYNADGSRFGTYSPEASGFVAQ